MLKKFLLILMPIAAFLAIPAIAEAAPTSVSPSITINQAGPYYIGDTLTFTTTVPKLFGWQYPMIDVQCYQDVDGDGTLEFGYPWEDIVYSELYKPSESFTLGGYSSIWKNRGGGPAECIANLDAYGWKGGQQYVTVFASTEFTSPG
jgi:hypothetical protein